MRLVISGGPVLLDGDFVEGRAVLIDEGEIAAIVHDDDIPQSWVRHNLDGHALVPGFIDSQVNGGGGVLFNDCPTVEAIAAIGAAHAKFGTTGFLPTLISDDFDVVRRGIVAVDEAIAQGVPGVLGIHIEGPFLNVDRKGIHDRSKIKQLDSEGFRTITALKSGQTLVTLAPERTTLDMIKRLVDAGAIVAAGHTDGTYEEIVAALASGLSGFTHLFNAMSPLRARHPGAVGAALTDQESWCGIIVDGHHIHPATLRIALKCKPIDKFMLVTDAMPSVGTTAKAFTLQGHAIRVEDGVCVNEDGTLAGSDLNMAQAVRNCVALLDVSVVDALQMASFAPAQFLKLGSKRGRIVVGFRADLISFKNDLEVSQCWIDGLQQLGS
jgi:N-acetylglucosamine-6-phosphate deacetylase